MSNNKNEVRQAIVIGVLDFLYLFASLILINPSLYVDEESGRFISAYGTSAVVYALGVLFPLLSRLIKGDVSENILLRIADILVLISSVLSICSILIYYIWSEQNKWVYFSYIMAILTALPSLFSAILAAREYIAGK